MLRRIRGLEVAEKTIEGEIEVNIEILRISIFLRVLQCLKNSREEIILKIAFKNNNPVVLVLIQKLLNFKITINQYQIPKLPMEEFQDLTQAFVLNFKFKITK